MDAPAHLLLVEDDQGIARPLVAALEAEGHHVEHVSTGQAALAAARVADAVLLDLGLPDIDGVEVCRRLRRELGSDLPILVLTARDAETDVVVGLDAGADDYVTKPFRLAELQARLRALLRRASGAGLPPASGAGAHRDGAVPATGAGRDSSAGTEVVARDVRLDPAARRAWCGDQELTLTAKEFDLLFLLVRHAGRVVTRQELARQVWDTHWMGNSKTIDVHVSSLRRKLGDDPADPRYITTLRGVGLRFEVEGPDADVPREGGSEARGGDGSAGLGPSRDAP